MGRESRKVIEREAGEVMRRKVREVIETESRDGSGSICTEAAWPYCLPFPVVFQARVSTVEMAMFRHFRMNSIHVSSALSCSSSPSVCLPLFSSVQSSCVFCMLGNMQLGEPVFSHDGCPAYDG
jgi:hypothetical protein